MTDKCIIVLVGPSGSGKTSIGDVLSLQGISKLVTTTTRKPRFGEENGVDYYFREFSELDSDAFVEQTIYNGNRYGLTKDEVDRSLERHNVVHVSLDQSGAEAVKVAYPEETCIVFVSITEEEMVRRMKNRGDTADEIQSRIDFCRRTNELTPLSITDLEIINEDIEESAQRITDYVLQHSKLS